MKKLFALLLALAMVLSLAACTGDDEQPTDTNDQPGITETEGNGENQGSSNEETTGNQNVSNGEVTEETVRNHPVTDLSDFEYKVGRSGLTITGYIGDDEIVVIPDTIEGMPVAAIAQYTFANESQVRGVYIPETVTSIEELFINNKVIEVVICEGIEKVRYASFLNCTSLHTVLLGDALNELGESAFANCRSLRELYIAPTLTEVDPSIGFMVFYLSSDLTIKGEAGSYIETFCAEQDIPFVAE